jgi:hypothetical protein
MVRFAEPLRQRPVDSRIAKKPLAVLDKQGSGGIGKPAAKQGSHGQGHIAFEFLFRNAGRLKILPVEIRDPALAQRIERSAASAKGRRYAQTRNGANNIRPEQRGVPGHRRPPIMADDDGLLFAERRDQRDHVADKVEYAVGADVGGRTGAAEAAHIRGDHVETSLSEGRNLMPPGIRQFRPAVTEQHQRTLALFGQEHLNAIGGNAT